MNNFLRTKIYQLAYFFISIFFINLLQDFALGDQFKIQNKSIYVTCGSNFNCMLDTGAETSTVVPEDLNLKINKPIENLFIYSANGISRTCEVVEVEKLIAMGFENKNHHVTTCKDGRINKIGTAFFNNKYVEFNFDHFEINISEKSENILHNEWSPLSRRNENQQLLIPIQMDKTNLLALFDTGAFSSAIDKKFIEQNTDNFEFLEVSTVLMRDANGSGFRPEVYRVKKMKLGEIDLSNVKLLSWDFGPLRENLGVDVPMILGLKHISLANWKFNLKDNKMKVTEREPIVETELYPEKLDLVKTNEGVSFYGVKDDNGNTTIPSPLISDLNYSRYNNLLNDFLDSIQYKGSRDFISKIDIYFEEFKFDSSFVNLGKYREIDLMGDKSGIFEPGVLDKANPVFGWAFLPNHTNGRYVIQASSKMYDGVASMYALGEETIDPQSGYFMRTNLGSLRLAKQLAQLMLFILQSEIPREKHECLMIRNESYFHKLLLVFEKHGMMKKSLIESSFKNPDRNDQLKCDKGQ